MAFVNQASVFWSKQDYAKTVALYEKARLFLPDDPLLKMFMGLNYLFLGKKSDGLKLLKEIRHITFEEAISSETIPEDFLNGKIDVDGLKAVFLPVDETRESILKKQKELEQILKKHPNFRAGKLHLATTLLQLSRTSEAKTVLESYHRFDPHHCIVEYYLAVLCMHHMDYNQSWTHLKHVESLTQARGHHPKALHAFQENLRRSCPES